MANPLEKHLSSVDENTDMGLILSVDAPPGLSWTPALHQRFTHAISLLGGIDKATPKTLMRMMGIRGLTLYQLKSHLHNYRLSEYQQSSQQSTTCSNKKKDCTVATEKNNGIRYFHIHGGNLKANHGEINESLQITKALHVQVEVEQRMEEHIERHLQLQIEAQGKYLQSVLKNAQDILVGYDNITSSGVVDATRADLNLMNAECSSSCSELTQVDSLNIHKPETKMTLGCIVSHHPQHTESSTDSCLTSLGSFKPEDGEQTRILSLAQSNEVNSNNSNHHLGRANLSDSRILGKRIFSTLSDDIRTEKQTTDTVTNQTNPNISFKRLRLSQDRDLKSHNQSTKALGGQIPDLNM